MEDKVVNLKIQSNIDDITKDVKKLSKGFEENSKEIKDVQKSTKGAEDGVKSLSNGFKGMGLAIKAIGIGLVLEAFNLFKEVLGKNQKVVDIFNTAIGALSIAFNDLIGIVFDNFPKVINFFKDVFENPTEYLKKFGDMIKENLIERFESFLDTVGFLGDALMKVFKGDFEGAMESVKKAGKESLDVLTGVNDVFDKGKKIIEDASNAIIDYTKNTIKQSKANIDLQNTALIAAAQQAKLVEQYDLEAEKLRKIRDNDLLSINERIVANEKLKEVLKNQQTAMKAQADLQVQAAQNTFNLNKSTENRVALISAQANALGVLAQVEGLTSEQESNRISLQKEQVDLTQSQIDGISALSIEQQKFNETLEADELSKLEKQRANLEAEKLSETERLQTQINGYALGTQARVDAELELKTRLQEIGNEITTNESEQTKARVQISDLEADAKIANLARGSSMLSAISGLIGQNTAVGKAAAVASATIDTYAAAQSAFKNAQLNPISILGPAYPYISAGLAIAGGLKNVKSILSVKVPGGGGGGSAPSGGSAGASAPASPKFNVVGASSTNQLAQTMAERNQQPIKTYVVSGDISTAQSLERNIISSASIG
tara:strand:+ start:40 stop:1854 length:1815 start_codon:yes stop_codon:yes gene_type:complete